MHNVLEKSLRENEKRANYKLSNAQIFKYDMKYAFFQLQLSLKYLLEF